MLSNGPSICPISKYVLFLFFIVQNYFSSFTFFSSRKVLDAPLSSYEIPWLARFLRSLTLQLNDFLDDHLPSCLRLEDKEDKEAEEAEEKRLLYVNLRPLASWYYVESLFVFSFFLVILTYFFGLFKLSKFFLFVFILLLLFQIFLLLATFKSIQFFFVVMISFCFVS